MSFLRNSLKTLVPTVGLGLSSSLQVRKLLVSRSDRRRKNAGNAELRYTAGTRTTTIRKPKSDAVICWGEGFGVGDELHVRRIVWRTHVGETKTRARTAPVPLLPILSRALAEHRKRSLGDSVAALRRLEEAMGNDCGGGRAVNARI